LISQRDTGSGALYYFGYDGLGSTRYLTGTNAGVTNAFTYDAFGILIASNTTAQTDYLFTGEHRDSSLGLIYLRARYSNPNTGRFWTRDSFAGNQDDPMSLHRYLYAGDNPINNVDPSGNEYTASGILTVISIFSSFAASPNISISQRPQVAAATSGICGPDVTAAAFATARDIDGTWFAAGRARAAAAALEAYSPHSGGGNRWWDVHKLNDLGQGDTTIDFGNGSTLGTGPIGRQTVQFSYARPGVYYAGSVNYFLWGKDGVDPIWRTPNIRQIGGRPVPPFLAGCVLISCRA